MGKEILKRQIQLPERRSCLILGPRQTGKSTWIRNLLRSQDLMINLLSQTEYLSYIREPGCFREEVLSHHRRHPKGTIFVDEVQKIPQLLDEVHDLIESHDIKFVLTGSSARKLKRGGANLLAGRAVSMQLFPLTSQEIDSDFQLERALLWGSLPILWNPNKPLDKTESKQFLRSYAETYLKEEILQEGLIRQAGPFVRFLEIAAENDGQIVNYSSIARECGVSVKTVQQYYEILEDTFLAYRIDSYQRSARRRLITHPKYYFFDTGVTNAIHHSGFTTLSATDRGRRFEQWVATQIIANIRYLEVDLKVAFWRTHTGVEVDLLLLRGSTPVAALECKSSTLSSRDRSGILAFQEDFPNVPGFLIVPQGRQRDLSENIQGIGWQSFVDEILPKL